MCLAVPGRIERIDGRDPLTRSAAVRFDGAVRQVHLAYVPEAVVGDYVLVHVGFAISVLDEAAARRSLELLAGVIGDVTSDREAGS
jgi:hydrogenase expression/formation protein HypC